MNKPQPHILYFPLHVFMLVMFFIVNGYRQNMEVLWFSRLLPLTGILLLVSAVLLLLAKKGQGTWHKAGLWVFLLMLVVLFYGVAEGAAQRAGIPVLRNWIYLSAIAVIGLPAFWIFLRRTKRSLRKITLFLNVLLVIYLAVEVTGIAMRWNKPLQSMPAVNIPPPANQHRPDIYFIILDEYMGGDELKNFYGYDNSFIERSLQQEGFHIVQHALCNYVNTTSSVGSMLNMQYLDSRDLDASLGFELTKRKLEYIRSNAVCKYLESAGYEISNQSIFHLGDHPSPYTNSFIPLQSNIFTGKTWYSRVFKQIASSGLAEDSRWFQDLLAGDWARNNELSMERTAEKKQHHKPQFTYTHLMMPHAPYLFDSTGQRMYGVKLTRAQEDAAYLQYLVYTNGVVARFIHELKRSTGGNAVILLMGDHGYKHSKDKGRYQTLNAVYLPSKNYSGWYEGMTHVNQFRVLFNAVFDQRLPLLKDSLY